MNNYTILSSNSTGKHDHMVGALNISYSNIIINSGEWFQVSSIRRLEY